MARAGRSSGSRSSGSRSSSRSSGSHRSSSSSRSRSSSSSRSGRSSSYSSSSSYSRPSYHNSSSRPSYHSSSYHSPSHHSSSYCSSGSYNGYRPSSSYRKGGCLSTIALWIIVIFIIGAIFIGSVVTDIDSTIERTKLDSGLSYDNKVVLKDELDWIESKSELGRELKDFYDYTGIQPYIMLLDYNAELKSDESKEDYTTELYDEYIDREDALLFVYYAEEDIDDVGLMCYALGKQASSIFDSEAVDILFNYVDRYWYDDISTVDVFRCSFNDTAKVIMKSSSDKVEILKTISIVIVVLIVVPSIYAILKLKQKRDKEKAEETERILKASMDSLAENPTKDLYE